MDSKSDGLLALGQEKRIIERGRKKANNNTGEENQKRKKRSSIQKGTKRKRLQGIGFALKRAWKGFLLRKKGDCVEERFNRFANNRQRTCYTRKSRAMGQRGKD